MLKNEFDAIVMLTWSDWFTEMRSNRYNFAIRFARHVPVIFVQQNSELQTHYQFIDTNEKNIVVLCIPPVPSTNSTELLSTALMKKKIFRPLLWIYNTRYLDFITKTYSPYKIYHATENYFCNEFYQTKQNALEIQYELKRLLSHVDLLVCVSKQIIDSYVQHGKYNNDVLLLTNGCDFKFYSQLQGQSPHAWLKTTDSLEKTIFYQGNIHEIRLDFHLLKELLARMRDWKFIFCGAVVTEASAWHELLQEPNLQYVGKLPVEKLKEIAYRATVAIIPFVQSHLMKISFPLKAFEYVACGLPVVSTPIDSLAQYPQIFYFARTSEEFEEKIKEAAKTRYCKESITLRMEIAKQQDYDIKFENLCETILSSMKDKVFSGNLC